MSIKYDVYETPSPDKEKKKKLHARVINRSTVKTDALAKEIEHATALTDGDVMSVLASLSYVIQDHLSQGDRIHIEGLGYFQLTVTSETVEHSKQMRGEHVKFKTIKFRPEQKLKKKLSNLRFTRAPLTNHSQKYSDGKVERLLKDYFQEHSYITRKEFQNLCFFTKSMALERLKELVEKGILKKGGIPKFPIYEPVNSDSESSSKQSE